MRFSANVSHHHMTRHVFPSAGAAGSAMATAGTVLAQQPAPAQQTSPARGPLGMAGDGPGRTRCRL